MKKENKIVNALLEHYFLNFELGICYLNLSNQAEAMAMFNLAKYLRTLSNDKLCTHKDRIYNYILVNRLVIKGKLNEIKVEEMANPGEIMKFVQKKEMQVRELLNEFSNMSLQMNDHETFHFLTWFVNDGLKDYNEVEKICQLFELSNDNISIDQAIGTMFNENCK